MKYSQFILVAFLSAVVAFSTAHFTVQKNDASSSLKKETKWEQIKKRGTLRCGYYVWPPFLAKDPNTGEMSGVIPDITNEIAKQMDLKVEWVAEVDYSHMFSGYDKYDMICSPLVQNGARARESDFSMPIAYGGMYAFVRVDDNRFNEKLAAINDPKVRVSTLDGEYSSIVAGEDFPKAQTVPVSQLATGAQMILQVATGKADIAITDLFSAQSYMENNPGKIKLASQNPLRVFSISLPLPHDELAFKSALNATISNLNEIGFLDKTYRKYEKGIAHILRVARPYEEHVLQ